MCFFVIRLLLFLKYLYLALFYFFSVLVILLQIKFQLKTLLEAGNKTKNTGVCFTRKFDFSLSTSSFIQCLIQY